MNIHDAEERAWAAAFGTVWVLTGSMANRAARRDWCKHVADDAVEAYRELQAAKPGEVKPPAPVYPPGMPDRTKPIPEAELAALFEPRDTWDKPGGKENP